MSDAFVIDALRTPVGRRNGGLAKVHPADLAGAVLAAIVERTGIDSAEFDEVILGAVDQIGPQSMDVARTAWLAAGLSERVPGTTVERQCGSGQQAIAYAAQGVMSGSVDLVVAGGVQNMSMVPLGASRSAAEDLGFAGSFDGSVGWSERYGEAGASQIVGAEMMVTKWGISREDMEDFSVRSHERALRARAEGRFDREILPVAGLEADEGPRAPDRAKMASLRTLLPDGLLTAATSSPISDGAAAVLIASEQAVARYGLKPRARVHAVSGRGDDPVMMLSAPIEATRHALRRTGMTIHDMALIEINEAFAPVVLAWQKELHPDPERVNVNGGALALGHPIGASGARLLVTLLHELERTGGRFGLQTMCEGGGQANVTIIERLDS